MSTTSRLTLPLIAAGQAQKHVTYNEALLRLDTITQLSVLTRAVTQPPITNLEGDSYIIATPASGAFLGKENQIAFFRQSQFDFFQPKEGFIAYVQDEDKALVYDGLAWITLKTEAASHTHIISDVLTLQTELDNKANLIHTHLIADITDLQAQLDAKVTSAHTHIIADTTGLQTALDNKATLLHTHTELQNMTLLGIGTTADVNNPLSAKLNTALITAKTLSEGGTGDVRYTLNKESEANTVSLIFQSNWSGRAEMGLAGQDNYAFRVSPDGSIWQDAIRIDKTTAQVDFPQGYGKSQLDIFTNDGTWLKPLWAKRVIAMLIGGGGGGGSGRVGIASSSRYGGGGGGAGGYCQEEFLASELPSSLSVIIGNGGAGAADVQTPETNGNVGADGQSTILKDGANNFLSASGGNGGQGGSTTSAFAGAGGFGSHFRSNSGGIGGNVSPMSGSYDIGRSPSGGGGGGGVSAANSECAGAVGGFGYSSGSTSRRSNGGVAGAVASIGGNGSNKTWERGFGAGGGGGGGGQAGGASSGGWGGNGGNPGGGGGGGGSGTKNAFSGAGGQGGRGEVWMLSLG